MPPAKQGHFRRAASLRKVPISIQLGIHGDEADPIALGLEPVLGLALARLAPFGLGVDEFDLFRFYILGLPAVPNVYLCLAPEVSFVIVAGESNVKGPWCK